MAGAVSLLCENDDASLVNQMIDRVVERIYRNGTRSLFKLICPDAKNVTEAGLWEASAYNSLEKWDSPQVGDSVTSYHVEAQKHVVEEFKRLLRPFNKENLGEINTDKKVLHQYAKQALKDDSSGLSLSLIMAHNSVQQFRFGKSFAWRVFDIDGYKTEGTRGGPYTVHFVHEVKSSSAGLNKAKDQLQVRAGFLDATAAMMGLQHNITVHAVAAIMRSTGKGQAGVPVRQPTDEFEKISQLILTTAYFRP